PYCGSRLRRRAPKLPRVAREHAPGRGSGGAHRPMPSLGRLRRGEIPGLRAEAHPYATIALVLGACLVWIASHARPEIGGELWIVRPLHGEWWRLLGYQFVYSIGAGFTGGLYMLATLLAVAIFGGLLERRHGPLVVLALFFAAGLAGGLAAEAVYTMRAVPVGHPGTLFLVQLTPILSGANAGALALLAAWAVPDLLDARAGRHYEGDLLGTAAIAGVVLAMPFAHPEASWLAGVVGGALGLLVGLGLSRGRAE
ncbi:MAG TPA: rhomboid family intramembrane serine protease, partial [Solirubrobacteraceae bacterium]|nr:rhomboid family intramembrane serine protease [Solirubrobacteraceae bacterium]